MKRRGAVAALLGSLAAAATAPASAMGGRQRIDKRLLGTWRSDKERTNKYWRYRDGLAPEMKKKVEDLFGKLVLTYTETEIHADLEGHKETLPYTVVASDESSVVIAEGTDKALKHIRFEEGAYYMEAGTYNFEFFKRVDA